jgi:hypothetical protein
VAGRGWYRSTMVRVGGAAILGLAAACGPPPPWHAVVGAGSCVHRLAREPAAMAPAIRWEPGCPGDAIAGCERLVIDREVVRVDGANAAVGPAIEILLSGEGEAEAFYDQEGRPLLVLETTGEGCAGQIEFAGERAALVSRAFHKHEEAGPVVFSGKIAETVGWHRSRVEFSAGMLREAVLQPLADGTVALVQEETPEAIVAGAGAWRAAMATGLTAVDAAMVGDRVAVLMKGGQLRVASLTGEKTLVLDPPDREIGGLRADDTRLFWLEVPTYVPVNDEAPIVTIELRAAEVTGEALQPRTLARFPYRNRPEFFANLRPFNRSFHGAQLPYVGIGPGGVFVHVDGEDGADRVILVGLADEQAWGWRVAAGR